MFSVQWFEKLFTIFTKPLYALLIFNIVFSLYHIPLVFDMVKTSMWLHGGYTSLLFVLSLFYVVSACQSAARKGITHRSIQGWLYFWKWDFNDTRLCLNHFC